MTSSIWRISHLTLAILASIFILLASLTGAILALEPILDKVEAYEISNINEISVSETITNLKNEYKEVINLQRNENNEVKLTVINNDGKSESIFINPLTGKKIGDQIQRLPIFKFATNLHRSLFLKSTGRAIMGFVSFFLFLITLSGFILIYKRQGSFKAMFSKIVKENTYQYYHIIIGRYALVPIIIISITAIYLSLEKFHLLPNPIKSEIVLTNQYKNSLELIKLNEVNEIEFPFSKDDDDNFILKLSNKQLEINQYSGFIVKEKQKNWLAIVSLFNLILHTGKGSISWSLVLFLSCISLIFFIYSGFNIFIKRRKAALRFNNIYTKDDAKYIVLYGSENGDTYNNAIIFCKALINAGEAVHFSKLNDYSTYTKATQIVIFTSTYGNGDAPSNARVFEELFPLITPLQSIKFSVVGFGSLFYEHYCRYAIRINGLLQNHPNFIPLLPLTKVNEQSVVTLNSWVNKWSKQVNINFKQDVFNLKIKEKPYKKFKIKKRSELNIDSTFTLQLKPKTVVKYQSGDILHIQPNLNVLPRAYSIAKIKGNLYLSIRKHDDGLCSNFLNNITVKSNIKAYIEKKPEFHFPKQALSIVFIANGTGIAPFLGMLHENKNKTPIHLFFGVKYKESLSLYLPLINKAIKNNKLTSFYVAFSQEQDYNYVQDIMKDHTKKLCDVLSNQGKIMICGSINMQHDVLNTLENITKSELNLPLSKFENNKQLAMDCY